MDDDDSSGTILVTARSFGSGSLDVGRILTAAGYDLVRGPAGHEPAELLEALKRADAWITGPAPVPAELLEAAPRLAVLARHGSEVDAIDLETAGRRNVVVTHTPGAGAGSVSDHAVALLLAALRGVVDGDRRVRERRWTITRGRELGALTVGVLGLGGAGEGTARRLLAFGCTLLVHDPALTPKHARQAGLPWADLAELTGTCDAVVLHAGPPQLVGPAWLETCRLGQVVVNAAGPDLVDEPAVAAALRAGTLAAYATDSLASRSASPLLDADLAASVVVTPALAEQTVEAIDRAGMTVANDVLAVLTGNEPLHAVPLPRLFGAP